MGRPAAGVTAVRLEGKDEVVAMDVGSDGDMVLLVTSMGFGKRTPLDDFPVQGRGGGGVKAFNVGDRVGQLVSGRICRSGSDVLLASAGGLVVRMRSDSISLQGRAAQGVSLMNVKGKDTVASMGLIEPEMMSPSNDGRQRVS